MSEWKAISLRGKVLEKTVVISDAKSVNEEYELACKELMETNKLTSEQLQDYFVGPVKTD